MDLRSAALSGFRWMAAGRAVAEVVGFASTIVLARLIPPGEYGRAVVVLAFSVVTRTLFQEGLTSPLIARKDTSAAHLRTAAFVGLAAGAALGLVFLVLVPPVVGAVFDERTGDLVRLLAPVFVLEGLAVAPRAMLQRSLDFRRLGLIELAGLAVTTVTTLALAFAGADATAVVVGTLAAAPVQVLLLLAFVRPPRPGFDAAALRQLVGFGGPAAASAVAYQLWRHVDYAVVGARLGAAPAGIFWRAYSLALEYPGRVSGIMLRLALPLYARTESSEQMHRLRGRIVRAHATALFPALVALIVLAPTLVPFLYGARWEAAVVPTQILAVGGLFSVVSTGFGPLMLAAGKVHVLLAVTVTNLVVYGAVVYALAPQGLDAVALGAVGAFALSFVLIHVVLERVVDLPLRALVGDVGPAFVSGAAMLVGAGAAAYLLREAGVPDLLEMAAVTAVGVLVYVAVLRQGFRPAWGDMTLLTGSILRRGGARA